MVKKETDAKIRQLFFDYPNRSWSAREIARTVKSSHPLVIKYLTILKEQDLIEHTSAGFRAKDSLAYKRQKRAATIERLYTSELIDQIIERSMPSLITLFGSACKGEDNEESDIDIFVDGQEIRLDKARFEKKMNRTINITYGNTKKLNKQFLESVANGTILYGGIRI